MMPIELTVNGVPRRLDVDPTRSLLGVLRDELGLTGAKYGCGEGQCGACTVLVDGAAVRSCVTAVAATAGAEVRTIEGLADPDRLHPVQAAFLEAGAMQCGYCTAGMILAATALLERRPEPDEHEIRRAMNGNVCRCGSYPRIVDAIRAAGAAIRGGGR